MSSPLLKPNTPERRLSFNYGGDGENVRVTAPLCAIIVLLIAVAIPLWVCAFSASAAPWMEPADVLMPRPSRTMGEYYLDMEMKTGASASVSHHKRRVNTGKLSFLMDKYEFAMVTDLDKRSRDPDSFTWKAYLKKGMLRRVSQSADSNFTVSWGETLDLVTHTSTKNRSMELSELVRFNRNFFAMCDMTGIIFKVQPDTGRVFQRYAIADGNGDEPKPFKIEWATVKDNLLWVGSVGKEISGSIRPAEWVKTIDKSGDISNIDWGAVYQVLRSATNTTFPGYLWHEAVHFDHRRRLWVFLPRKESQTEYHEEENERKGSNLMILANEDFSEISVKRVGPLERDYGFTAVRKLPGTELYVALKVKEQGETVQHSVITVFDLEGNLRMDSTDGSGFEEVGPLKYEGIEFLNIGSQITSHYP